MYPPQDWREDYEIDSDGTVKSTTDDNHDATNTVSDLNSDALSADQLSDQDDDQADDTNSQEGKDSEATNDTKVKKQPPQPISIGQFFTGGVLSREEFTDRLPVIIYVVVLMLLYIANGFHVQQRHSRVDKLNAELKRLNTVATTTAARRMSGTRQGEIEKLILQFNLPLSISPIPPRIIEQPNAANNTEVRK